MPSDPLPELQTDRLILRHRSMADLEACVAMDTDPHVMRYIEPMSEPDVRRAKTTDGITKDFGPGLGIWGVFAKDAPKVFLGWAALIPLDGAQDIEVGYRFRQAAWGKGYATESARALLHHGFKTLDLEEIVAVIHPDNARSQRVVDKLGLGRDGMRFAYGSNLLFYRLNRDTFSPSLESP